MHRGYNMGGKAKIAKKVSNFEDHAENFFSDKKVHFYKKGFHETYSTIVT
jgi:hypothetical protein